MSAAAWKGEKTRQGDSTLIDIRTFVRHLSAYFRSERWVSSNPYFEEEKRLKVDGRCLLMRKSHSSPTVSSDFLFFFPWPELSQTNIKQIVINKSFREPFKHFKSHYDDKGKQIGRCKTLD